MKPCQWSQSSSLAPLQQPESKQSLKKLSFNFLQIRRKDGFLPPFGPHQQAPPGRPATCPCLLLLLLQFLVDHLHLLPLQHPLLLHSNSILPSHCQDLAEDLPGQRRESGKRVGRLICCVIQWPCCSREEWNFHQVNNYFHKSINCPPNFQSQGWWTAWVLGDQEKKLCLKRKPVEQVLF